MGPCHNTTLRASKQNSIRQSRPGKTATCFRRLDSHYNASSATAIDRILKVSIALNSTAREFLDQLLTTAGVSGYEQSIQSLVRNYAETFTDHIRTDLHGNVIFSSNPEAATRVMLAGHCDQIGLIVSHIDENGFLYTQTIGGWDPQQLVGQSMTVWASGGPIDGVISRKPIHLLDETERKQVVKTQDLWIDIGASSCEEAKEHVRIGDSVTLRLGPVNLLNNRISSPALDNRTGLWVVIEAHRRASEKGLRCGLFTASTVQEEIGLRGAQTAAYSIDPHIGIAVDVTHATDCPTIDQRERGQVSLGAGPVIVRGPNINPRVEASLQAVAVNNKIDVQTAALGRAAPNDTNALQVNRQGVATGLVAIPNRYMHSAVEVVSLDDIDAAADLLAHFILDIGPDDHARFVP